MDDTLLNYFKDAKPTLGDSLNSNSRDHCVLRIIDLCNQKGYRDETTFLAISVFDRVFSDVYSTIKAKHLPIFIVAATIIAAKVEQPMTPSINRMIKLLPSFEQEVVSKEKVILLEEKILVMMNFDMTILSPLTFLERFMRVLSCQRDGKAR